MGKRLQKLWQGGDAVERVIGQMRNIVMQGIAGQDRDCKARPAISGFIDVM